jgi:hypothetical protein
LHTTTVVPTAANVSSPLHASAAMRPGSCMHYPGFAQLSMAGLAVNSLLTCFV